MVIKMFKSIEFVIAIMLVSNLTKTDYSKLKLNSIEYDEMIVI